MINISSKSLCSQCFEKITSEPCPKCGFSEENYTPDPSALPCGSVLQGRYAIGGLIGKGGFGITYLAYDTKLDRKIAVKEFFPLGITVRNADSASVSIHSTGETETFKKGAEKFYDEARMVAKFNGNSSIVSVYDFFYENATVYYTMEYLQGQTVKECVSKNGAMNPEQVKYIAEQVASALAAVHGENVLHRDVSPDNIMICGNGRIKLLDFGAARQVVSERSQNFSVILKPGFAPLEQYQKKGRQGPWTDIYSLGTTLYYCLTGKIPEDPMSRVESDNAFEEGLSSIDGSLREIIRKAASLKIEDRYKSAEELLRDLRYGVTPAAEGVPNAPAAVVPVNNAEVPQNAAIPAKPAYAAEVKSPAESENRGYEVPAYAAESSTVQTDKKPFIIGGIIAALVVIIAVFLIISLANGGKEDAVTAGAETEKTTASVTTVRDYEEFAVTTAPPVVSKTTAATTVPTEEKPKTKTKKTTTVPKETESTSEAASESTTTAVTSITTTSATTVTTQAASTAPKTETTANANMVKIGSEYYDKGRTGTLNLSGKKLKNSDIANLKYMTNISELIISNNNITDLSAVSGLTNLKKLTFHNNDVSDISFAKNLKKLTVFGAENNGIEDISALSGLKDLEQVWLQKNAISDISALSGCTKLQYVSVSDNLVTDLTPLAGKNLIELHAANNELDGNCDALKGLIIYEKLYLEGNGYDANELVNYPYLYSGDDDFDCYI